MLQPAILPTRADSAFANTWDLVRTALFRQRAVRDLIDGLAHQSLQVGPYAQLVYWQRVQEAAEFLAVGHFTAVELHHLAGRRAMRFGPDKPSWRYYRESCGGPPGWPYGLTAERVRGPSKATIRRAVLVTAARIEQRDYGAAVAKVAKSEHLTPAAVRQSLSRVTRWLANPVYGYTSS